jgi:hypothetical protein
MSRLLRATVVVTYVAEAEDYGTPSAHGMCQLDVENIEIYVEPVVTT